VKSQVRVARACRDAGIASVAVYADPDRDALHVRAADEAYALGGDTPATSYLDIGKVLGAAAESGADPSPRLRLPLRTPTRQAVLDAGLTWIGPPPQAIRDSATKVAARHIAQRAGAPLVAGTPDPVSGSTKSWPSPRNTACPSPSKPPSAAADAAQSRPHLEEIPELYDYAVRESSPPRFGRGECFVERLPPTAPPRPKPNACRHPRNVVVVSTATAPCTPPQKLVEEARTLAHRRTEHQLYTSSKAILREAGYTGAGTCEFLVGQDGTISFLEVNTRLQVETPRHRRVPASTSYERCYGSPTAKPSATTTRRLRGHSIEFRINGEDPGPRLPTRPPAPSPPSPPPTGPGVGSTPARDRARSFGPPPGTPLLAKLIITGATREQALQRAAAPLGESTPGRWPPPSPSTAPSSPTPPSPQRRPLHHPHPMDRNRVHQHHPPFAGTMVDEEEKPPGRETVVVEVAANARSLPYPPSLGMTLARHRAWAAGAKPKRRAATRPPTAVSGDALPSPMQGTIVKVAVRRGPASHRRHLVVVLEAMKMNNPQRTAPAPSSAQGRVGHLHLLRRRHLRNQGLSRTWRTYEDAGRAGTPSRPASYIQCGRGTRSPAPPRAPGALRSQRSPASSAERQRQHQRHRREDRPHRDAAVAPWMNGSMVRVPRDRTEHRDQDGQAEAAADLLHGLQQPDASPRPSVDAGQDEGVERMIVNPTPSPTSISGPSRPTA